MIEFQKIDCNCNDCGHMVRDLNKFRQYDYLHTNNAGQVVKSGRVHYGDCKRFSKPVSFIPNTCQLHTQQCFEHRKGVRP
jgi:hypothetical protein